MLSCYFRALRLGGVLTSPQVAPSGLQMTPPSLPGTENPGKPGSPDFILIQNSNVHMGDSREVPHVNIVRKLRHSCEDVNFAPSIYSNTLKQFNFIVDYCLSLHIMYKHSQTHSEHFL